MNKRTRIRGGEAALLIACLGFVLFWSRIDSWMVMSPWWRPWLLLVFLSMPLFLLGLWLNAFGRRATGVALLVCGALTALPWHPAKRFQRDLFSLAPGATLAEVDATMHAYMRNPPRHAASNLQPGMYGEPGAGIEFEDSVSFRWTNEDAAHDADIGVVFLREGRVVKVKFLPD